MVEPDRSQQASEPSQRRRRDYAPGSNIAAMQRLLEKHETPLELPPSRQPGVAGIVFAVVAIILVFATLAFLAS